MNNRVEEVDKLIEKYTAEGLSEIYEGWDVLDGEEDFRICIEEYNEWAKEYVRCNNQLLMKHYPVIPKEDIEILLNYGDMIFGYMCYEHPVYKELSNCNFAIYKYMRAWCDDWIKNNK